MCEHSFYFNFYQRGCTSAPIIGTPEHYDQATIINDDCLFMVMYSDALGKAIEKTGFTSDLVDEKIAGLLIEKIKTERSLSSAAQSVVDEIKRDYDNACISGEVALREDLTLIVRVFRNDLKKELVDEDYSITSLIFSSDPDNTIGTSIAYDSLPTEVENVSQNFDAEGLVIPYVDFSLYNQMIENNLDIKNVLDSLETELNVLTSVDDTSRL